MVSLSLGAILIVMYQWISQHTQEDVKLRLEHRANHLKRVHNAAAIQWVRQLRRLAEQSHMQRLTNMSDRLELQHTMAKIQKDLNCAAIALLSPSGEVLAWKGVGKRELEQKLPSLIGYNLPENRTELFVINGRFVLEVAIVRLGGAVAADIVGARLIDSAMLANYGEAIDAAVELRMNDRTLVESPFIDRSNNNLASSEFPINKLLHYVVHIDFDSVSAPLYSAFRIVACIGVLAILLAAATSVWIANAFTRPIEDLTAATTEIVHGDMSLDVAAIRAPQLHRLARNINEMIHSIIHHQERLNDTARKLEEETKEREIQATRLAVEVKNHEETMAKLQDVQGAVKEVSVLEERMKEHTVKARQLDDEIKKHKQTMAKLRDAYIAAEEATRAKSEFLANMSHELRTPLHGILSFANFGITRHSGLAPEKALEYFKRIEKSGRVLLALVDDLLDLSKLESGKMNFYCRPADVNELITSVIAEFSLITAERNLVIEFPEQEDEREIVIDPKKIAQVVRNLISNAVKFSSDGDSIKVSSNEHNGSVMVSVCDNGVGIPLNELEIVFDKFMQSSVTKTGAGGTGLGLPICKEIVLAHKGRIWADPNPDGRGTLITFTIPKNLQPTKSSEPTVNSKFANSIICQAPKLSLCS